MLYYVVRTGLFGLNSNANFEHPTIRGQNVLVIGDITTSGSVLNEILLTLRVLNPDNSITIFSLIGRKDLMAEAMPRM